jgi:hypothetical protein
MLWIDFIFDILSFFKFKNGMNKVLNELLFCACVLLTTS